MAKPTPADFILLWGNLDATELSNVDDASATQPNIARLQWAIDLAMSEAMSFIPPACIGGKLAVLNSPRIVLSIARYLLDITLRARPDVSEEYKRCIEMLKQFGSKEYCSQGYDKAEAEEADLMQPDAGIVARAGTRTMFEFDKGRINA